MTYDQDFFQKYACKNIEGSEGSCRTPWTASAKLSTFGQSPRRDQHMQSRDTRTNRSSPVAVCHHLYAPACFSQ